MAAPKLFISYSWSSPEHEQWVLDLAIDLKDSGVDAILDKWKLKEGHDAVKFMEKMVTDENIRKVVIISDKVYARKADDRDGGVGTETQIISKEIYDDQEQDKFVVVLAEKDDNGRPFLPTYYKSRIYIDLCEPEKYTEEFEKLLRWVFDKPLYVEPELGSKPSFLEEGDTISLGTTAVFRRTMNAIKNSEAYAPGALDEYLDTFVKNFERFRISKPEGEFDDAVVQSIEDFLPYRNEAVQLFHALCRYSMNDQIILRIHRFFESLVPYMFPPENVRGYSDEDFDNFQFIIHELFLYAVAILIKNEHFDHANLLMELEYYVPGNSDYGRDTMSKFIIFRRHTPSLAFRNNRLELQKPSLRADLLRQRCTTGIGVDFQLLMQADFVIYLRAELEAKGDYGMWYPETLLYSCRSYSPFEIFARSVSKSYFERIKCLLAINLPADLSELLRAYKEDQRRVPQWGGRPSFDASALLGFGQLATRP